jgi:hypothetical protein
LETASNNKTLKSIITSGRDSLACNVSAIRSE